MKSKVSANIDQDVEKDVDAVATAENVSSDVESVQHTTSFEVRPSETVSIVAGNRILFVGSGLKKIRITR